VSTEPAREPDVADARAPYDLEPPLRREQGTEQKAGVAEVPSAGAGSLGAGGAGEASGAGKAVERVGAICEPLFPGPRVLVLVGVTLTLVAMILAASQPGAAGGEAAPWALRLGRVLVTLFDIAVHTGTGMVAVLLMAVFLQRRVGGVDLAAARMLVAVSACVCVMNMPVDRSASLATVVLGLRALLALGAYWVLLLALFRRSVADTNILAAFHVSLYLVMVLGTALHSAVQSASVAGVTAGGAP